MYAMYGAALAFSFLLSTGVQAGNIDMRDRLAACQACHGEQGEGQIGNEYYPHLAGKPAGYLKSQLSAFRDGRRSYPPMRWLVRNMDDEFLDRIAKFYESLPPRSSAHVLVMSPSDAARAEDLVERGDPDLGVPACTACHGKNLAGLQPNVPALLGLPPDYVIAQLGAWRTGVRKSELPDCMSMVARRLDPADFRRLGEWLATQGASGSLRPAPADSFELPKSCGEPEAEHGP